MNTEPIIKQDLFASYKGRPYATEREAKAAALAEVLGDTVGPTQEVINKILKSPALVVAILAAGAPPPKPRKKRKDAGVPKGPRAKKTEVEP